MFLFATILRCRTFRKRATGWHYFSLDSLVEAFGICGLAPWFGLPFMTREGINFNFFGLVSTLYLVLLGISAFYKGIDLTNRLNRARERIAGCQESSQTYFK